MGMIRHDELTRLFRDLEWNFHEFGEADLVWHGRNRHSYNRLFLVREGSGSVVNHSAGEILPLKPGLACFMPTQLDLEFDFPPGLRLFSFHFQIEALPGVDLFSGGIHCINFAIGSDTLHEATEIASTPPDWGVFFALQRLICSLLPRLEPLITLDWQWRNHLQERYNALLEFMRKRATATTPVAELATVAGRPYDRLSREFRRDFGCTMKEFLAKELCRRAESKLRHRNQSIKEIATELGFSNEFYFSRFFRCHTGMAPRNYRNSIF